MKNGYWLKTGLLISPENIDQDSFSHFSNPIAVLLYDDVYRIYFNSRDNDNRASIFSIELDIAASAENTKYMMGTPLLSPGVSQLDPLGISSGCITMIGDKEYLYYMGWQHQEGQPWCGNLCRVQYNKIDNTFFSGSIIRVLSKDNVDPLSFSYPCVIEQAGLFHMWYGSTIAWDAGNGEMLHVIKYANSIDGEHWEKHGQCIPHALGKAQAFSRPCVHVDKTGWHMWFSYRGNTDEYKIGYAYSFDGMVWTISESGISKGASGWDADMICYPFVFKHKETFYMLYNGNGYGKTGIGLAKYKDI